MQALTKTGKKIQLLQALIDHPRTGDEEREAGRRMLARILAKANAKANANGEHLKPNGWTDHRTYGAKYDQVRGEYDIAKIAELMREDIKLSRKIGLKAAQPGALAIADPIADAPAQIKFAVRTSKYAGGGSINIVIRNVPEDWWETAYDDRGNKFHAAGPALQALAAELRTIHQAYNYNGSDATTDYFDVNYYGSVNAEEPESWTRRV